MGRKKGELLFWAAPLALIGAVVCTLACGVRGWVMAAVLAGFFAAWYVGVVLCWVILVWLVSLTVDLSKPEAEDRPFYRWLCITIIGLLVRVGRLRITVKGWENVPEGRFLLVGNHRSNYDPIAAVWAMRRRGVDVAFITKPENMKIPLVRLIHKANFLVIDRDDPRRAIATINAAADLLGRDVVNVGVYPEGTRSKAVQMGPFHNAVFKIAQKAKVPILVAQTAGSEKIGKNCPWRRTDVTIDFCACIPADEVTASSTKALGERVRACLERAGEENDRP